MTLSSDTVTFYFDDDLVRVPYLEAMDYLRQFESFTVFVSFVHPATGKLVQEQAVCYPNPQTSRRIFYSGFSCFLTEVSGLIIKIPADLDWFSDKHTKHRSVTQEVSFLSRGEIDVVDLSVEIGRSIRIPRPGSNPIVKTSQADVSLLGFIVLLVFWVGSWLFSI